MSVEAAAMPMPQAQLTDSNKELEAPKPTSDNHKTINAPMVGTFYKSPYYPDEEAYVQVGDTVSMKQRCILEAMKLFNEIQAEISGEIVEILVRRRTNGRVSAEPLLR